MLIDKGKPSPSEPWKILEVSMNQSPDLLAIRLSKELKKLREPGVQILVPMRPNESGDPEWIVEHVYVRGANGSLSKLANTPGIDFVRPELADPQWIQSLLKLEQEPHDVTVSTGAFVRILAGPCARMCGTVRRIKNETITAAVEMRTKTVIVHTHQQNLQLIDAPQEHRVFFYQNNLF